MKKCPYCGAVIQENARFCLYCMEPLQKKKTITTEKGSRGAAVTAALVSAAVTAAVVIGAFSVGAALKKDEADVTEDTPVTAADTVEDQEKQRLSVLLFTGETRPTDEPVGGQADTDTEPDASTSAEPAATEETDRQDTESDAPPAVTEGDTVKAGETTVTETEPETTAAETVRGPETTPAPDTEPETEPETEPVTTDPAPAFAGANYRILSAAEIHELMLNEMSDVYGDQSRTMDRVSAEPSYSENGWEGFRMERIRNGRPEQYGYPVIYLYDTDRKAVIHINDLYSPDEGWKMFPDVLGTVCRTLGVYPDGEGTPEAAAALSMAFNDAGSQTWRSTRAIRGFKEEKRPDGWRGALAENGIYDKYGEVLPTYNMSAEYTYWEITIPCADRDIELLFELREWTNTEGTGMSYCDGAVVIGYAE